MIVKEIWSGSDFEDMGWHDSALYQMTFPGMRREISFDIDYIFEWVANDESGLYDFWVAPCVLVFRDVLNLRIDLDFGNRVDLSIDDVRRYQVELLDDSTKIWRYLIETDHGEIAFDATDFVMKVDRQPVFGNSQSIGRDFGASA